MSHSDTRKLNRTPITHGHPHQRPNNNRGSTCPGNIDDSDMDTYKQQTSHPSPSYCTPNITVPSITGQQPEYDPSLATDHRRLCEGNSSHSIRTAPSIPTLRHSKISITSRNTSSHSSLKSKAFRIDSSSLQRASSSCAINAQPITEPSSSKEVPRKHAAHEGSKDRSRVLTGLETVSPKQRPSVADIRKSFERFSQAAEQSGESVRLSFHSKSSNREMRQHQDKQSTEHPTPTLSMPKFRKACSYIPLDEKGQMISMRPGIRAAATDESPCLGGVEGLSQDRLSSSSLESLQCNSQEASQDSRRKTKIPVEPVDVMPLSRAFNRETSRRWGNNASLQFSLDGIIGDLFKEQEIDEVLMDFPAIRRERSVAKATSDQNLLGNSRIPPALSSDSRPLRGTGKVAQLRRVFERSSGRFASPLSFMGFQSRMDSEELDSEPTGDDMSCSWSESGSPTSPRTIARRQSVVPSITTEISVDDFFCDFIGGPNPEGISGAALPSEAALRLEFETEHESPMRNRIQLFERLSRDSLKAAAASDHQTGTNDIGILIGSRNENKRAGKRNTVSGWRPIHKTGAAIWRKISSTFSRSLDSWKDCNSEHEHINVAARTGSNASIDRLSALANESRHHFRRSSSFGYSLYRVVHNTSHLPLPSSQTAPNIELGLGSPSSSHLGRVSSDSHGDISPDIPSSPRKSFPIIARMSSGFRHPGWFGLDGHYSSKSVPSENLQSSEATASAIDIDTPLGDPNALHKAMHRQSAAEQGRRRHGEKTSRAFGRWKGKSKQYERAPSADPGVSNDGAGEDHSRARSKGKAKEIAQNEPKNNEAPSGEGENQTNKKSASGFAIFESKNVKLRQPKPRRPGQVRKLANMYKEKGNSGASVSTKTGSGQTLKESRQSFRQKASSALGFRGRKEDETTG
ncbi:hypothetical protein F4777DRAFT_140906 [Nemania sp. FL0916]|nr:hypothetical protein F4777DRAFT_140906 [Nemania sp. FL0916]